MKANKILASVLVLIMVVFSFASCSEMKDGGGSFDGGYSGAPSGGMIGGGASMGASGADGDFSKGDEIIGDSDAASDGTESDGTADESGKEDTVLPTVPAGQITAAAWNDNDNFDAWKKNFEQDTEKQGKFFGYTSDNSWGLDSYNRFKVTVKNGENAVAGAKVTALSENGDVLFSAVSDASGVAYLFVTGGGSIKVSSGEYSQEGSFEKFPAELDVNLAGCEEKKNIIDIMFVIDVTGSMGDELKYLKSEVSDVVARVCASDGDAMINLALLFYRDKVDNEEFKYFDFTDVTTTGGLSIIQDALDSQYATGGGDMPESVDEALLMAMDKQWSSGATTKLIFHILDAPPHSTNEDKENYKNAVMAAAEKGIRICPILCSGADTLTEYLTRQAAIYTGGTFIFVTDDSGIGNSHHDPDLPNTTIELLNSMMVRLIKGYHTGTFESPVYWKEEVKTN